MPDTGTLSFEVVFFPKNDPIREEVFVVMLEQLEQQLSTKEAMEHLIYICTDACVEDQEINYFTCAMVAAILSMFHDIREQWKVLQILLPKVVDPHCCKVVRDQILDYLTKRELYRWLALEPSLLMNAKNAYPEKKAIDLSVDKGKNQQKIRDTQKIGGGNNKNKGKLFKRAI